MIAHASPLRSPAPVRDAVLLFGAAAGQPARRVIQNTTLAQIIGAGELLESGERSVERLTAPPPIGQARSTPSRATAVMVMFFLISFPLTRLAAYLERRLV